ncbi:MAG: hypothetical protein HC888_01600 [Candidatus Competibacteraceae bacterium]|nr:hypothetical protein [Candidatus Competibacteraceae bacterium]
MHRADILRKATSLTTGDRNKTYGHPYENMKTAADMFTVYLINKNRGSILDERQFRITPEDAAHFMTIMKMVRTASPTFRPDNYIDASCYEAIAGECRAIEEAGGDYPEETPLIDIRASSDPRPNFGYAPPPGPDVVEEMQQ